MAQLFAKNQLESNSHMMPKELEVWKWRYPKWKGFELFRKCFWLKYGLEEGNLITRHDAEENGEA